MQINHYRVVRRLFVSSFGVLSLAGSGFLFGQTAVSFVEPKTTTLLYPDGGGAGGVVKADFNGDGKLDLAVSETPNTGIGDVAVLIGNGDGTFRQPLRLLIPQISGQDNGPGNLSAKDFDGDGKTDIVVAVPGQNKVYFYKGHGDGTFDAAVGSDATAGFDGVQAADLNGDGKVDIVGTNYNASKVTVMRGNGDGTFQSGTQLNSDASPRSIILADVNGDGKTDILAGCYDGSAVDVYLNNGSGTFPTSPTPFAANMQVISMYLGDFDGDGKSDLAVAGYRDGANSWVAFMKGGGDGTFTTPVVADFQPVNTAPSSFYGEAITPDVNGDGKPDVIFGHPDNTFTVGLGLGNGRFDIREMVASSGPGFASRADGAGSVSAVAGDFNGDGIQDIVVAQYATNARMGGLSLILGAGGGNFATPRSFVFDANSGYGDYNTKTVALVDVNGDGKLDIVHDGRFSTNNGQPRTTLIDVLLNNGDGTFGLPIRSVNEGLPGIYISQIMGVKVVDMNQDGKPDLVIAAFPAGVQGNSGTSATFVAYGNGDGTFGTIQPQRIEPGDPSWVVLNVFVGDFNGDGIPDIASLVTRYPTSGWHIEVYLQNPVGTFTRSFGMPNSDLGNNGLGQALAAFDFNGDGKLDLISQGSGPADPNQPQSIKIFKGNGDGTFQAPIDGPQPTNGGPGAAFDYHAADFDHDGKLDLVIGGYSVAVYLGNGNATFQAPSVYDPGIGGGTTSVDLADFDGDGNLDLALGNDSAFAVLLGNHDGSFSQANIFAEGVTPVRAVRAGDLNGDGKPDVVVFHDADSQELSMASVLINNSAPLVPQALNISTRMQVETGDNVLIGGFIITGSAPKNVAVRGIGPSLIPFGIADALADPTLELHDGGGTLIMANDDWQDNPSQAAQLTALGLGLQDPKESGIVATVQPGPYTAILAGKNQTVGVGLVEVYDANQAASSHLANISTRGFVLTGNKVMIGGFILGGTSGNTRVVVRGIGPSLAAFGISPVLADPTLELHDSNGMLLIANDNWQDDPVSAAQLTANGLAPQDPLESGVFTSLPPGAFTAVLAGKTGGTGIGLVEVYNLH